MSHAVHVDHACPGQPASAAQQVNAFVREPTLLARVGVVRDHEIAICECRIDVDRCIAGRLTRLLGRLAGPQQRLRRNARPIGAFTADQLSLYDGDAQSAVGQLTRAVLTRRAGAQDNDVIRAHLVLVSERAETWTTTTSSFMSTTGTPFGRYRWPLPSKGAGPHTTIAPLAL